MTSLNKSGIKLLKAQVVKKLSPPNNSKPSVESNIIKSSFVQKLENQYVIQNIIKNENRIFKYKHFINLSGFVAQRFHNYMILKVLIIF